MQVLRQDLVYAFRQLRRTPGFTFLVLLTVALGIGANTAVFSLINGFLRPLPVRDADRILVVASPGYKARAEGDVEPESGRGVQWESWLIRQRFYADQRAGLTLILPVVLPGCSKADIPFWLAPDAARRCCVLPNATTNSRDLP